MKTYTLYLHDKQGNDLGHELEEAEGDASKAFAQWAKSFKEAHDTCVTLAKALKGKNVEICAGEQVIDIDPGDGAAQDTLDRLVKEKILQRA